MSKLYWQSKIWGILHDPILKALHTNVGRGGNSAWQSLKVMEDWSEYDWDPENTSRVALKNIHLADLIASASDRGAIGSLSQSINYKETGIEIKHLLSGKSLSLKLNNDIHQLLIGEGRTRKLQEIENQLFNQLILDPLDQQEKSVSNIEDEKKVFWWLWRCLPEVVCKVFDNNSSLLLMPAETRLPDGSIWSHLGMTSALAGALAGFDLINEDLNRWPKKKQVSRPYLTIFSFTPVQELIKASRKMRDFWAGSWILHYLSAKVCWALAWKYGPDTLIYPSLFQQPLIDTWLLEKWPDLQPWIDQPQEQQLLTAGFPNILVLVLPAGKVEAAMQTAEQVLQQEWKKLGKLVHEELTTKRSWMPTLEIDHKTWDGWLRRQWQTYWSSIPIGDLNQPLTSNEIYATEDESRQWSDAQNRTYTKSDNALFEQAEASFLNQAAKQRWDQYRRHPFKANVGSWWPFIFDQARYALTSVKNSRTWQLPTAFSVRSSISGIGPAVHPYEDQMLEGEVQQYWQRQAGLFDGREQLNATETLKRALHTILPKLLPTLTGDSVDTSYPDLTAGVAGYLKNSDQRHKKYFMKTCRAINKTLEQSSAEINKLPKRWGIPWIDKQEDEDFKKYNSRYLNAAWLSEEVTSKNLEKEEDNSQLSDGELDDLSKNYQRVIQKDLDKYYPSNNPSDWYVLAAGDGDGMNQWLKGLKLKPYKDYIPQALKVKGELSDSFENFLQQKKRMGPSTHSALSRALLDFSNQLVPYLTESRYAGRLIYAGGDDVLAYTNLWDWDNWIWDIRECFRGQRDPKDEFSSTGNYWKWTSTKGCPEIIQTRPLFTMGEDATISFGVVIANQSVPLAIALENLWEAEAEAKENYYKDAIDFNKIYKKDALQVRVLYGNGNTLKSTVKFEVFERWKVLLKIVHEYLPEDKIAAFFEQGAQLWKQHPIPDVNAIGYWAKILCERRDIFCENESAKNAILEQLIEFLNKLWDTSLNDQVRDIEIPNWLSLAAFISRKRIIQLSSGGQNL